MREDLIPMMREWPFKRNQEAGDRNQDQVLERVQKYKMKTDTILITSVIVVILVVVVYSIANAKEIDRKFSAI